MQKKKTKEKNRSRHLADGAGASSSIGVAQENSTKTQAKENVNEKSAKLGDISDESLALIHHDNQEAQIIASVEQHTNPQENVLSDEATNGLLTAETLSENLTTNISHESIEIDSFKNLNDKLARMAIPDQTSQVDETSKLEIKHIDAYLQSNQNETLRESHRIPELATLDGVAPTAPILNEQIKPQTQTHLEVTQNEKPKVLCMPLDEAIRISGGKEMAAMKAMSEEEEAKVEAGHNLGPEYSLMDLLSTFRYLVDFDTSIYTIQTLTI